MCMATKRTGQQNSCPPSCTATSWLQQVQEHRLQCKVGAAATQALRACAPGGGRVQIGRAANRKTSANSRGGERKPKPATTPEAPHQLITPHSHFLHQPLRIALDALPLGAHICAGPPVELFLGVNRRLEQQELVLLRRGGLACTAAQGRAEGRERGAGAGQCICRCSAVLFVGWVGDWWASTVGQPADAVQGVCGGRLCGGGLGGWWASSAVRRLPTFGYRCCGSSHCWCCWCCWSCSRCCCWCSRLGCPRSVCCTCCSTIGLLAATVAGRCLGGQRLNPSCAVQVAQCCCDHGISGRRRRADRHNPLLRGWLAGGAVKRLHSRLARGRAALRWVSSLPAAARRGVPSQQQPPPAERVQVPPAREQAAAGAAAAALIVLLINGTSHWT